MDNCSNIIMVNEAKSKYWRYCIHGFDPVKHWTKTKRHVPRGVDYMVNNVCLLDGQKSIVGVVAFTEPKTSDKAKLTLKTEFVHSICSKEHFNLMKELWPTDKTPSIQN
jgi:hypothetical protein